jgi:ubiquinone/menaquinone biosynthesis C-methylase UbiE
MVNPELYDRNYFLSHCEGYREFAAGVLSSRLKKALRYLPDKEKQRILDIGCGRGEFVQHLAKRGHSCEGIDYSRDAIDIAGECAGKSLDKQGLQNCRFQIMDAQAMQFDNDVFDAIFMLDVVEHLHPLELDRVFQESRRVLKPGGKLIIHTVPNKWVIKPARLVMRLLKIPSETDRHVNEQSIFSLKKAVAPYFSGNVWIEREKRFWWFWADSSNRVSNQHLGMLLRAFDFMLDNVIVSPVIKLRPFIFFLGTDIWGNLTKRAN